MLHKIIVRQNKHGNYEWTILPEPARFDPAAEPDGKAGNLKAAIRAANKQAKRDYQQIAYTYMERKDEG
jgi:hypothetical protein